MISLFRCILIILVMTFLLTGCATYTTTTKWIKSDYTGGKLTSILVVGATKDKNHKLLLEDVIADNLLQNGVVKVTTSLKAFPNTDKPGTEAIVRYVQDNNIDGVLVTRVVDIKKESVDYSVRISSPSEPSGDSNSFPSYYAHAYETSYVYGQTTEETTVQLEILLFKSDTEELIWSMSSKTFSPKSANQVARRIGRKIIRKLKRDKLI